MANKRRQFSADYKRQAVAYVAEHDVSITEAAKNLGVGISTLSRWIREAEENGGDVQFIGSGNKTTEQLENEQLKRDLKDAHDAIDILKKAMGILSN